MTKRDTLSKNLRNVHLRVGLTHEETDRCWEAVYARIGVTSADVAEGLLFLGHHSIVKASGRWWFIVGVTAPEGNLFTVNGVPRRSLAVECHPVVVRSNQRAAKSMFFASRSWGNTKAFCRDCGQETVTGHHEDCDREVQKRMWPRSRKMKRTLPRSGGSTWHRIVGLARSKQVAGKNARVIRSPYQEPHRPVRHVYIEAVQEV